MKSRKQTLNALDVDFIGGEGPLTKDEESAISELIKAKKRKKVKNLWRDLRPAANYTKTSI